MDTKSPSLSGPIWNMKWRTEVLPSETASVNGEKADRI